MCIHDHGFVSDPSKTLWENIPLALQVMPPSVYFNRNKNMTCHNLCTFLKPPAGFASLLGLGLKFCIQQKKPPKSLAPCVQKLARSLQIQALYGANATSLNRSLHSRKETLHRKRKLTRKKELTEERTKVQK